MKNLKKILSHALRYKSTALLNIFFNVLSVIFELLALLLFIPFLNLLFEQSATPTSVPPFALSKEYFEAYFNYTLTQYIDISNKAQTLLAVCVLVGVLFLLKNIFRYLGMYFIAIIRTGVVRDIRGDIHQKFLSLPLHFYSEEKKGDLMSKISTDVQEIEWSIMSSLEMLFREPIAIVLSLLVMININAQLTLFSFVLLPISGLIIGQLGKSLKRSSLKVQEKMGHLLSAVEETLSGLRIIKAFNAERAKQQHFEKINSTYTSLQLKMTRKRDMASPLSEFLGSVVMVTLAYYGGSLVLDDSSSFDGGQFIGFIIIFSRLINPVKAFSTAYTNIQKGAASVDRIQEVLTANNPILTSQGKQEKTQLERGIAYKNVHFSYTSEKEVLSAINLSINKGQTIALVGESGGGKSTIADLLPRFYDVTSGAIEIDGVNIKDFTTESLRNLMGIVTQDPILFNDSVLNNILMGDNHFSTAEVIAAAKVANAHDFIEKLEKGYDTEIGDRGNKLSGGQRQRISIARAVLRNPDILILDEATSALDTESEKLVQMAIDKLMENRTALVIAHRLSTIQHADLIIVLQSGKVVESGTHLSLINQKGVYYKLHEMQVFQD